MSNTTIDVDVALHVYNSRGSSRVGHDSIHTTEEHPATGNTIDGWKWDRRLWPFAKSLDSEQVVPTLFDGENNFLSNTHFQSGYGAGKDIQLLEMLDRTAGNTTRWIPKLHNGNYYVYDEKHCLSSDYAETVHIDRPFTHSGLLSVDLNHRIKNGSPICVRRWLRNKSDGSLYLDVNAARRYKFTGTTISGVEQETFDAAGTLLADNIDRDNPEFIIDVNNFDKPRIITNKDIKFIGRDVTVTGVNNLNRDDLSTLELLGVSNGTTSQTFYTKYFPISTLEPIEVYAFDNTHNWQWERFNVVSGVKKFAVGDNNECYVNPDFGNVEFGDYLAHVPGSAGHIPVSGYFVAIRYASNLEVKYEPHYSQECLEEYDTNIDPLVAGIHKGFVQVSTQEDRVGSVVLASSDMTQVSSSLYTIDIGNNYGALVATVKDLDGSLLEGVSVTFTIASPAAGTFSNGQTTFTSKSNSVGQAKAYFVSPSTINDISAATRDVSHSGSDTVLRVDGIPLPTTVTGEFFLWRVDASDEVLGTSADDEADHYTDFFTDEGIDNSSADEDTEKDWRTAWGLPHLKTYTVGDITTGRKRVVVERRENNLTFPSGIHPHSGVFDPLVYTPVYPKSITNLGTSTSPELEITYGGVLLPTAGSDSTLKSYMIGGSHRVVFQASAVGSSGRTVYSNTVNTNISVPDEQKGSYICDAIAEVPTSFLSRIKNINSTDDVPESTLSGHFTTHRDEWIEDRLNNVVYASDTYTTTGSELLDNPLDMSAWTQSNLTVALKSSGDGPTGKDVYVFNEVAGSATQYAYDTSSWNAGDFIEISFYAKFNLRPMIYVSPNGAPNVRFNLEEGYYDNAQANTEGVSITDVGDGWYKCVYRATTSSGSTERLYIYLSDDNGPLTQVNPRIPGEAFYMSDASIKICTKASTASRVVPESFVDWFRRTYRGDSELLGLADVSVVDSPGEIPIGWRLKDSNSTFGSVINGLTFIDANDTMASGYFG